MPNLNFFSLLFLISLTLSLLPPFFQGSLNLLYFSHSFFQLLASTSILLVFDRLLKKSRFHRIFIITAFFLFVLGVTHFTLARLMDTTAGYLFQFLFGGGISNLLPAWQALNLNAWMIASVGLILAGIPLGAIYFYRITDPKMQLSFAPILFCLAIGVFAEFLLPPLSKKDHSLPWGITPIQKKQTLVSLPHPIQKARNEFDTLQNLSHHLFQADRLPNIYLFIIESFRRDFVTAEIAPTLHAFGKSGLVPDKTHANANSTFPSWFSILHADFPHHWAEMRDAWKEGSIPLKILKNLGYELFVYSSADLSYFHLDDLLFGEKRKLIDSIFEAKGQEVWAKDASCIDRFEQTFTKSGRISIFFLDSTHSEYSIPPDFPAPFQPAPERIDYLILDPRNVEPLKNRYRNSVRYVDSLFSRFLTILKTHRALDEAMIVVTGDHGEEFFEDGSLFHGTHLNEAQTAVPILYQLPSFLGQAHAQNSTHIDILPTILHAITKNHDFSDLFDGESLFYQNRRPYRLAIHHNCASPPNEFLIETDQGPCHFKQLDDQTLEIVSGSFPWNAALHLLIGEHAITNPAQKDSSSTKASLGSP